MFVGYTDRPQDTFSLCPHASHQRPITSGQIDPRIELFSEKGELTKKLIPFDEFNGNHNQCGNQFPNMTQLYLSTSRI